METDGVNSNLDIFWETTSEGLITELNQAVLGGTADAVSLSGFNASIFKEGIRFKFRDFKLLILQY
jgi:hypothetical protein